MDERYLLANWGEQKISHNYQRLAVPCEVDFEFVGYVGHPSSYAYVKFACEPVDELSLDLAVEWPKDFDDVYALRIRNAIAEAILDVLFSRHDTGAIYRGCRLRLTAFQWDNVGGSEAVKPLCTARRPRRCCGCVSKVNGPRSPEGIITIPTSIAFGGVIMLRFENQADFVEIDLASQETDDLPSRGDARLTIRVSAAGFTGHNALWVLAPALRSFCQALVTLERNRRGEARLASASPEELSLVVHSVDSRGHMAIEGSTGYEVRHEHSRTWHSVDFGFEFDPSQLVRAIRVDWVRENAKSL